MKDLPGRNGLRIIAGCARMAVALLLVISSASGQQNIPAESDATGAKILQTAQFKEFIDKYIAAVNAKDREGLRGLYDPVSQAAMAKDGKDAADILDAAMEDKIPPKHDVVVSMIGPKEPLMFEEQGAVYAVRPLALVQINFSTGPNDSNGTVLFLAPSGDQWREVWAKPPDENKMEAAMQKAQDDESGKAKGVKESGVTDYRYEPNPTDETTRTYTWEVRLTEEDSKKEKYEIVQIDQPSGGAARTTVLVERPRVQVNEEGYVGFRLGIGEKKDATKQNGEPQRDEPLVFSGIGTGIGDSDWIHLPAGAPGDVEPAEKGATLVDGTLRLIRFNTDANEGKIVTDIVLRTALKAPTGGDKVASAVTWDPDECSTPLMLPVGYQAWENGTGRYHVSSEEAQDVSNGIAITFQSEGTMDPETVPGARETPFKIKGQEYKWRVYRTEVNGKPIIRKEMIIPNILPHAKGGTHGDYIWVRIDASTQERIDTLTPVAGGILRDCL